LDVPCKLRWDVHELGQWNDATVLYPCDRVSTGTDSRAVTRMVPDDLGGGYRHRKHQASTKPVAPTCPLFVERRSGSV
jgi:hypothetical protein